MREAKTGSIRTLERDICDIRESGLLNAVYDYQKVSYALKARKEKDTAVSDKKISKSRQNHLIRLKRIGTLLSAMPETVDKFEYDMYLEALKDYTELLEQIKKNPSLKRDPDISEELDERQNYYLAATGYIEKRDLKAEYYEILSSLYGEKISETPANERTRQRDFAEINNIPWILLYYDKKIRKYIYCCTYSLE
ncbi:MAG: hypothetical protein K5879_00245 [Lachnospiraceae bacterium]|nr:hypothetical protein [Lachnospiraceae bacterium]